LRARLHGGRLRGSGRRRRVVARRCAPCVRPAPPRAGAALRGTIRRAGAAASRTVRSGAEEERRLRSAAREPGGEDPPGVEVPVLRRARAVGRRGEGARRRDPASAPGDRAGRDGRDRRAVLRPRAAGAGRRARAIRPAHPPRGPVGRAGRVPALARGDPPRPRAVRPRGAGSMNLAMSAIAWEPSEDEAAASVLREHGFTGVELAPTKIFPRPDSATGAEVAACRAVWSRRGLRIVAMQALLFGRPELTVFGESREQTLEYLSGVARLGGRLGAGALVFGSPRNRARGSMPAAEAWRAAVEFFRALGSAAAGAGTCVCIEPNPPRYGAD